MGRPDCVSQRREQGRCQEDVKVMQGFWTRCADTRDRSHCQSVQVRCHQAPSHHTAPSCYFPPRPRPRERSDLYSMLQHAAPSVSRGKRASGAFVSGTQGRGWSFTTSGDVRETSKGVIRGVSPFEVVVREPSSSPKSHALTDDSPSPVTPDHTKRGASHIHTTQASVCVAKI